MIGNGLAGLGRSHGRNLKYNSTDISRIKETADEVVNSACQHDLVSRTNYKFTMSKLQAKITCYTALVFVTKSGDRLHKY